jgi:hypothetical protein
MSVVSTEQFKRKKKEEEEEEGGERGRENSNDISRV